MNRITRQLTIILAIASLLVFVPETAAQKTEVLICTTCQYENRIVHQYCGNCGESLSDEHEHWQAVRQVMERDFKRFISERIDPPKLFTVPAARVLGSLDIRLTGGGAFGVAADRSFLGKIGVGLGDIAEIEFSTVGMVTNITRGSATFPTSAFKLLLINENRWHIPTLAVSFRSSADWQDVQSDKTVLDANSATQDAGITAVGYDTRFTEMNVITSAQLWSLNLHAGVSLTDVRVRDLSVESYLSGPYVDPEEKQKNLLGGFIGFEIESNPQTKLMFELKTVSNYQFNVDTKEIDVSDAFLAIGGVRFFFSRWLSTDVGVWYHSTFKGIADLQIKLGLNLFIPGGELGSRFRRRSAGKGSSGP
ncbi:MAG: hypothetical protein IIA59_11375 [Candidatus Marinimicrobia bacterium]|nr:hypothetical protein [Candidatus Neomarinimicrobiota bacterium]